MARTRVEGVGEAPPAAGKFPAFAVMRGVRKELARSGRTEKLPR